MNPRASGADRATIEERLGFHTIIDVRSPSEFALDHIPGAINLPSLDDEERSRVGTLHKQVSAFSARLTGAALVARNIATHLQGPLAEMAPQWRPLLYCWRGGKRSQSFTHVLREVGWDARQLSGGYKAYRKHLVETLPILPGKFSWRAVCGLTGTGKSRLLQALDRAGAQVLDLEQMAAHRGSVLGGLPAVAQPSQKSFESALWQALSSLDPAKPVYVEAESRKIGVLQVPDALLSGLRGGQCIVLQATIPLRVQLLREEYAHFLADAPDLAQRLGHLAALHGRAPIERWQSLAHGGHWDTLVEELLLRHYDPAYERSIGRNFPRLDEALRLTIAGAREADFDRAVAELLAEEVAR